MINMSKWPADEQVPAIEMSQEEKDAMVKRMAEIEQDVRNRMALMPTYEERYNAMMIKTMAESPLGFVENPFKWLFGFFKR